MNQTPPVLPTQTAPIDKSSSITLLTEPRKWNAGRGLTWINEAIKLYTSNFVMWLFASIAILACALLLGLIPVLNILVGLMFMHVIAGVMVACSLQVSGGKASVKHVFSAIQTHFLPLLGLSVLNILASLIMAFASFLPISLLMSGVSFVDVMSGNAGTVTSETLIASSSGFAFALASVLILTMTMIPMMLVWHAPALIVLHDVKVIKAMKMSFIGSLKNILPLITMLLFVMVAVMMSVFLTFGLGTVLIFPALMMMYYTTYRDIWSSEPWQ